MVKFFFFKEARSPILKKSVFTLARVKLTAILHCYNYIFKEIQKKSINIRIVNVSLLCCRLHSSACSSTEFNAKSFLTKVQLLRYQFIPRICLKCFVMDTERDRGGRRNLRLIQWTTSMMICGLFTWCQMPDCVH